MKYKPRSERRIMRATKKQNGKGFMPLVSGLIFCSRGGSFLVPDDRFGMLSVFHGLIRDCFSEKRHEET